MKIHIDNKKHWPYFRKLNNYLGDCNFCTRPLRQGDCSNSRLINNEFISICCFSDCKQKLEDITKIDHVFGKYEEERA